MPEQVEVVEEQRGGEPAISEPGKLMRIAVMLREVQEEARRAPADEAGRERLRQVHERALGELCGILNEDLQKELTQFSFPFEGDTPTQSEMLIAQAQLIGWLEGLFQGIQAAIFNQQLAARQQLEGVRQRALTPGQMTTVPGGGDPPQQRDGTGQYL